MQPILDALLRILDGAWDMLLDVAPFLLLGFLVAGALKVLLPDDWIARRLGGRGLGPVTKAALLGVPLPLCSCGVIPAAMGLRKQGASRGATLSFLVSTPETGVDSVAVTYAILGPFLTVVRPVAAFLNAVTCGVLADLLGGPEATKAPEPEACACCGGHPGHRHTLTEKARSGLRFAFVELLDDIAWWLIAGVVLAGVITAFLGPGAVHEHLGSEWVELLLMLAISIPLYICATASTPVAAALIVAGISPGAALVLLLAGPATNVATLLMVGRFLGARAVAIYLGSIAGTSLLVGWLVNRLTGVLPESLGEVTNAAGHLPAWLRVGAAALLLALMANLIVRRFRRPAAGCCGG